MTIAPLVNTSIFSRPLDILSTLVAKRFNSVMCGVPEGFALWSFQRIGVPCAKDTAGAAAAPAAIPTLAVFKKFLRFMLASS